MTYDLVIIGSGPAGLSASVYASRYSLKNVVIGDMPGGIASQTHDIGNWLGTQKISGFEFSQNAAEHAKSLGAEIIPVKAEEIKKVEDYTLAVDEITPRSEWNLWGCEFVLGKPEAYPIKTYTDFGLDKDPKEEFKVDPIAPVIELFASIEKGEQMWMQIVVRPSKVEYRIHGVPWYKKHAEKYQDWVAQTQVVLDKILNPYTRFHEPRPDGVTPKEMRPPPFLDNTVKGITNKRSKLGFDTGIRICYVAKKESFSMNNRRNIRLIFRQYAVPSLNSLERCNSTQADAYSSYFPASKETVMLLSDRMLLEFRERSFFHTPLRHALFNKHTVFWPLIIWLKPYFHASTFVLNVEELATLWHFPGQILQVPSFERIESKEAAPPSNLPI